MIEKVQTKLSSYLLLVDGHFKQVKWKNYFFDFINWIICDCCFLYCVLSNFNLIYSVFFVAMLLTVDGHSIEVNINSSVVSLFSIKNN